MKLTDYMTPRQKHQTKLRSYLKGTQYEGMKHFLDQSDPAPPILERAPCVVIPIAKTAIRSHVDMLFATGREVTIDTNFDRLNDALKAADVQHAAAKMLKNALGYGDAFCIVSIDAMGELCFDNVSPWKVAEIKHDDFGTLQSVEIRYPYKDGETTMIFRRVITAESDITFYPVVAPENPQSLIRWEANAQLSVQHNLGFVPVVHWHRDEALHEDLLDEIDALNRSASQRHRATLYAGDPQIWETGVQPGEQDVGRFATLGLNDPEKNYRPQYSTDMARKKGVSTVWSSSNENAAFGMLTLPGDALVAIENECQNLRSMLMECMHYVDVDLSQTGIVSDVSGKALEILHKRQITFDASLRVELQRHVYNPLIAIVANLLGFALSESVSYTWGEWFEPSAGDAFNATNAATAALSAGIITVEQAQKYLERYFKNGTNR